jgi:hypothetical protein
VRHNWVGAETADDNTETNRGCRREDDRRGAKSPEVALAADGCVIALVAAVEDGEQRSRQLRRLIRAGLNGQKTLRMPLTRPELQKISCVNPVVYDDIVAVSNDDA